MQARRNDPTLIRVNEIACPWFALQLETITLGIFFLFTLGWLEISCESDWYKRKILVLLFFVYTSLTTKKI